MNGEEWGYENWDYGEPNNGLGAGQSYLQLYVHEGTWDDFYGEWDNFTDIKDGFVCEWGDIPVNLKVKAIERGGSATDNIICDMTSSYYIDYQGHQLTEPDIAQYGYGTYGNIGFTADGNSRIILRVQTNKPGYATFKIDDIGVTLETLQRSEIS